MKKLFLFLTAGLALSVSGQNLDYPIKGVNFTSVHFTDRFWLPRLRTNHHVTIPASFERCESTGRVKNFEMAAARSGKFATTFPFDDTDIYKTIEGASFSLSLFPDKKLEAYLDTLIAKIGRAQEPDGYLYTNRTIDPAHPHAWAGTERWQKEREMSHELYNAGHLYEAAAAHYYATGKKNLLQIALKNADLVCSVFGPGKQHVAPGHEIIEMGLVKLYRITGKKAYLETAKDFIDARGTYKGYDPRSRDPFRNGSYWQDARPLVNQTEAEGHAVRAGYLYAGVADVAALTGDAAYLKAIDSIWNNLAGKKIYVTGGLGAVPGGERFGDNYELPNSTAYNETCAAIAGVYFNHRMFLLHGDAAYIDLLEKILYNSVLPGVGLDGKSFFYSNAMQVKHAFSHRALETGRAGWFECSCCPTNMTRLLPAVPGYVYAQKGKVIYVNLFVNSDASLVVEGNQLSIRQQNNYPWDGQLRFDIEPKKAASFNVLIRIPGWAKQQAIPSDLYTFASATAQPVVIRVNGSEVPYQVEKGYAVLNRTWKKNDRIEVSLPMEVKRIRANSRIREDQGKVALQRGPIVYCAEGIDNGGRVSTILVPADAVITSRFRSDMLGGVQVLEAEVPVIHLDKEGTEVTTRKQLVTAIPYYSWANRGKSEMTIWFPEQVRDIDVITSLNTDQNTQSK